MKRAPMGYALLAAYWSELYDWLEYSGTSETTWTPAVDFEGDGDSRMAYYQYQDNWTMNP